VKSKFMRGLAALLDKLRSASAHGRRGSLAVAREMTNELAKG
jgi:hypothetical protein